MKRIVCALLLFALATLAPQNIHAFVAGQSANSASQTAADRDAFVEAVKRGDAEAVKNFLSRGVSPNEKDSEDNLALSWALRLNRADIARLLLDRGADVNASEPDGDTPLMIAASVGRLEFTRELLSRGASVDARDKGGHTALISAAMGALFKTMPELLVQAMFGGDEAAEVISLRQTLGDEHAQVMSLLLDRGADVNAQAHDCGLTA